MKKETVKIVHHFQLGKGTYIRSILVPKSLRTDKAKTDGIRLVINSSSGIFTIDVRDWEAVAIIEALSHALLAKKVTLSKNKKRTVINKRKK